MNAPDTALQTVSRHLSSVLLQRGFRRKGYRWIRAGTGVSHIIEIQSGRWNVGGGGDFTLNLAVFVPLAYEAVWDRQPSVWPRAVDCVIDIRIGEVLPEGRLAVDAPRRKSTDRWWDFDLTTDAQQLGDEVAGLLLRYGLPFLDQFDSLPAIHDFLALETQTPLGMPVQHLYLAAIKVALAHPDGARELLASASERFPAWRERAQEASVRLGLSGQ